MPQPEIFYVLNSRWPTVKAYGLQVAKTCQGLKQMGAKVRLIVPTRALHSTVGEVDPFVLYAIEDRYRIIRLPSFDFAGNSLNGKFLFYIQQAVFAFMVACSLTVKKGAIYSRDPFVLYFLSFLRRNIFWEVHRFPGDINARLYRRLIRHVSGVIVITEGLRKLFAQHGLSPDRISVIPDAVDPEEFNIPQSVEDARRDLGLPTDRTIIEYVGQLRTLGESKGIDDLLHAFKRCIDQGRNLLLLIVGGHEHDIARYRTLALQLGITASDIMFTGHQLHNRIPLYVRSADVLVMPFPYSEHYAFYMSPLKLFEYMASGKPVVASDLPSVREIVSENEVFFCRPGDPQSIADAVSRVISNPDLVREKTTALNRLLPMHTWRNRGERILTFITQFAS